MKTQPNVVSTGMLRSCKSIQALAAESGVSPRTIRRAMRGENVNPEQLGRILKALKIDPKDAIEQGVAE